VGGIAGSKHLAAAAGVERRSSAAAGYAEGGEEEEEVIELNDCPAKAGLAAFAAKKQLLIQEVNGERGVIMRSPFVAKIGVALRENRAKTRRGKLKKVLRMGKMSSIAVALAF